MKNPRTVAGIYEVNSLRCSSHTMRVERKATVIKLLTKGLQW